MIMGGEPYGGGGLYASELGEEAVLAWRASTSKHPFSESLLRLRREELRTTVP
jgi:hypothetical protein